MIILFAMVLEGPKRCFRFLTLLRGSPKYCKYLVKSGRFALHRKCLVELLNALKDVYHIHAPQ